MSDFVAGKCGRLFPVYGIGCGQNRWCGPGAACPHCKKILELEEGKKNAETRKRIAERQVIELKEGIRGRDEEVIPDIESERDSKEAYIIELEADLAALREENAVLVDEVVGFREGQEEPTLGKCVDTLLEFHSDTGCQNYTTWHVETGEEIWELTLQKSGSSLTPTRRIEQLEAEVVALRERVGEAESENECLREHSTQPEADLAALREENEQLRGNLDAVEEQLVSIDAVMLDQADKLAALREENEEQVNVIEGLRMDVASEGAVLAMTVARLGGLVEGRPTLRLNFLQRVDELVEIEAEALRE